MSGQDDGIDGEAFNAYKHTVPITVDDLRAIAANRCPLTLMYSETVHSLTFGAITSHDRKYIGPEFASEFLQLLEWLTPRRTPDAIFYHHGEIWSDFHGADGRVRVRIVRDKHWNTSAVMMLDGRFIHVRPGDWDGLRHEVLFAIDHLKRITHKDLWRSAVGDGDVRPEASDRPQQDLSQ